MSVTGEFHRLVADCVTMIAASGPADATHWVRQLEGAAARSEESLDAAALAALELLEDGGRVPSFASASEREAFRSLAAHLAAICRVIVGRPAHPPGSTDPDAPGGSS